MLLVIMMMIHVLADDNVDADDDNEDKVLNFIFRKGAIVSADSSLTSQIITPKSARGIVTGPVLVSRHRPVVVTGTSKCT